MDIKPGDWAFIVKPTKCCGFAKGLGRVVRAVSIKRGYGRCDHCGEISFDTFVVQASGNGIHPSRLKKIDPPSTGDEVSTRKEMKEPAHG